MSTESVVSSGTALASRVDAVAARSQDVSAALQEAQRARQLIMLALVAFVCITCYAYYRLATRFQQKEHMNLLLATAEERLEQRSDYLMKEVQSLVDYSAPRLSTAFYDQAKKDLPDYLAAVQSERDQLAENLQTKLEQKLRDRYEALLAQQEAVLREEFPSVTDKRQHQAMMANLQVVIDRLLKKHYVEELQNELLTLYRTWDEFPPAQPAGPGELPLEDQIVGGLLELLQLKMSQPPAALAGTLRGLPPARGDGDN